MKRSGLTYWLIITVLCGLIASCAAGKVNLIRAASEGQREQVDTLLAEGADVNEIDKELGQTALIAAAKNGHTEIVRRLIAEGADVNAADNELDFTPLIFAAREGHSGIVEILLENGADVNANGKHGTTAMGVAIVNGYPGVVTLLRKAGARQ
jgi:uncharacterized protein